MKYQLHNSYSLLRMLYNDYLIHVIEGTRINEMK